ncbi:hypothetical protein [Streptomyces sp. NPDC005004]
MSALTVSQDPYRTWDDLVRFREERDWPEGGKAEITEGIVTVSPSPAYRHNVIAESPGATPRPVTAGTGMSTIRATSPAAPR